MPASGLLVTFALLIVKFPPGDVRGRVTILSSRSEGDGAHQEIAMQRQPSRISLARLKCFSYNPVAFLNLVPAGVAIPLVSTACLGRPFGGRT